MDVGVSYFHGNFRWSGQPPAIAINCFMGALLAVVRLVKPHPFRLLNLNHLGIMHDYFHHAEAQRFDVLNDKLQPFGFVISSQGCLLLILAHNL
jgi:hypothetical protein